MPIIEGTSVTPKAGTSRSGGKDSKGTRGSRGAKAGTMDDRDAHEDIVPEHANIYSQKSIVIQNAIPQNDN